MSRPIPYGRQPASPPCAARCLATPNRPPGCSLVAWAGFRAEHALFSELLPGKPTYAFGYPGGAAPSSGLFSSHAPLSDLMRSGTIYPTLARALIEDVVRSQ